jgi:hypothetical protein
MGHHASIEEVMFVTWLAPGSQSVHYLPDNFFIQARSQARQR